MTLLLYSQVLLLSCVDTSSRNRKWEKVILLKYELTTTTTSKRQMTTAFRFLADNLTLQTGLPPPTGSAKLQIKGRWNTKCCSSIKTLFLPANYQKYWRLSPSPSTFLWRRQRQRNTSVQRQLARLANPAAELASELRPLTGLNGGSGAN